MNLSTDQMKAVESGEAVPVVIDATRCVVIREDVFHHVQNAIEQDHAELRTIFARSIESSDWNDPQMDIYDDYDNAKK